MQNIFYLFFIYFPCEFVANLESTYSLTKTSQTNNN